MWVLNDYSLHCLLGKTDKTMVWMMSESHNDVSDVPKDQPKGNQNSKKTNKYITEEYFNQLPTLSVGYRKRLSML